MPKDFLDLRYSLGSYEKDQQRLEMLGNPPDEWVDK